MADCPTVEQVIKCIEARGFRVNNLYQMAGPKRGAWRANLYDEKDGYEFGEGATMADALAAALAKVPEVEDIFA